jgi:hypothetical protein
MTGMPLFGPKFYSKANGVRFGLPLAFLERQKMLQILYDSQTEKSKILCGKKVTKIEDFEESMTVYTEDGSTYKGDLVVGADGVHSQVRAEMWRLAEKMQPGIISNTERNSQFNPSFLGYFLNKIMTKISVQRCKLLRHDSAIHLCFRYLCCCAWPGTRRTGGQFQRKKIILDFSREEWSRFLVFDKSAGPGTLIQQCSAIFFEGCRNNMSPVLGRYHLWRRAV